MPYTDDPNNPRSSDPNAATDANNAQLTSANSNPAYLAYLRLHPEQMPDNTEWNAGQTQLQPKTPMNPWPLIAGLSAPLAASFLLPAAGAAGGASAVGDAGDAAGLADTAATGVLPSTTIATGISTLPTGGAGLALGAPGASAGLPNWLKTAQDVGQNLAGLASGRAQGRALDAYANQGQNRAAVDLYNTELNAPRTIARNAVKGDFLANAQDATISGVSPNIPIPTISGGLRPSMFSDATRQTGRNISTAAANTPIPTPTAPVLPPLPQANGFDSFLNTAGTIGGLAKPVIGLGTQIPWGRIF